MITKEEIMSAYDADEREKLAKILEEYEIIGGELEEESYEGSIYVLMRKGGKLYEFSSGHCSCYGFADFEPEEVTLQALKMRNNEFINALVKGLDEEMLLL